MSKDASIVVGGERHALGGTFFQPTVGQCATSDMLLASGETFGPIAAVFCFKTEDEVIQAANSTTAGLAAYSYAKGVSSIFRLLKPWIMACSVSTLA